MLLSDYTLQVQELVHDLQFTDFTQPEMTNYVNNARKRVALDLHCVRSLYTGLTFIANQETYPITSGIGGVTVTAGGANYTPATVVSIAAGSSTTAATAVPVIVGGAITQINMTNWGLGYTAVPAVSITDTGGGTGAAATAANGATFNVFDILSVAGFQGTQRYTMNWKPFTPFQAFMRADPTRRGYPFVWSDFKEINKFFLYPIPDQTYVAEIDALTLPSALVNVADVDTQILDPPADAVQFYAAHLALLKLQNFEQAEYMHKKYKARTLEIQATRQDRRIANVYQNWQRRINRGY